MSIIHIYNMYKSYIEMKQQWVEATKVTFHLQYKKILAYYSVCTIVQNQGLKIPK